MILTPITACAAPLTTGAKQCVRCKTRYNSKTYLEAAKDVPLTLRPEVPASMLRVEDKHTGSVLWVQLELRDAPQTRCVALCRRSARRAQQTSKAPAVPRTARPKKWGGLGPGLGLGLGLLGPLAYTGGIVNFAI